MMVLLLASPVWALDAHGFAFEGVTGDVEDYDRQGYPVAGVFGDGDISLILDYAKDPLTEITPEGRVPVVSALGTATLSGAYSFGALRLEAALPVHPIGTDPAGSFSALGDASFGAVVPIPWTNPRIPLMALHTVVGFPTGSSEHFVGADSFRFTGTAVVAQEFGPVGLIGTAGVTVSRPEEERNLKAGIGPVLGLGTAYRMDDRFSAALEFTGESEYGFSSFPVEATVSGRYRAPLGAWATAGAAAGLSGGVGSSRWRLFVGVGWSFREENHKNLEPVVELDTTSDRDHDGIVDIHDACPDQIETVDGFADEDGCPELDGDGDGVPFVRDQCPQQAIRPEQDPRYSDGCPRVAELDGDHIVITETIFFKEGQADLLPASEHVLTAVRDILQQNPKLGPILIEGHTNANGSDSFNLRLSDARAYAVMGWLIDHGIDPDRLLSKGYGESRPLVPESDPNAEAVNRRVEFRILSVSEVAEGRQIELTPQMLEARRKAAAGIVDAPPPPPVSPKESRGRGRRGRSSASRTAAPTVTPPAAPSAPSAQPPPPPEVVSGTAGAAPEPAPSPGASPETPVPPAAEAAPAAQPSPETPPAPQTAVPEAPQSSAQPSPESPPAAPSPEAPPPRSRHRSTDSADHH